MLSMFFPSPLDPQRVASPKGFHYHRLRRQDQHEAFTREQDQNDVLSKQSWAWIQDGSLSTEHGWVVRHFKDGPVGWLFIWLMDMNGYEWKL